MNPEEIEAMYREANEESDAEADGRAKEVEGKVQEARGHELGDEQMKAEGTAKKVEGRQQRWLGSLGRGLLVAGRTLLNNSGTGRGRVQLAALPHVPAGEEAGVNNDLLEEDAETEKIARDELLWRRRRDIPIAILAWIAVFYFLIVQPAQHIARTLLILVVAALLAYALTPAVTFLERFVPRFFAVLFVYLVVLGAVVTLVYFVAVTAIAQFNDFSSFIRIVITPGGNGTFEGLARTFGIQASQIENVRQQIVDQVSTAAKDAVPLVTGFFGAIIDMIVVAVLSIYFILDGKRVASWLRRNTPRQQRGRVRFLLDTLQRIVGGYIRGQLTLCTLIGVLVGGGMYAFGVPYALLLGVLAFIFEFIPILGTIASGGICVLVAATKGSWIITIGVLVYFIVVHIIEGDIIGPRVVGKAVGLHPIVALAALIAGGELFGLWGALFASPIAGVLQALLIAIWLEWRERHPDQFQAVKQKAVETVTSHTADRPLDREDAERSLSQPPR